MTREQGLERALMALVAAVTHRNRLSEDDAALDSSRTRRHQSIDFTGGQLRAIGKALMGARRALEAPPVPRKVQVVHHTGDEPEQASTYVNCGKCLDELPEGQSPRDYKRLDVGLTTDGIQVWCVRHGINVTRMQLRVKEEQ